jgi:hypothetical protein
MVRRDFFPEAMIVGGTTPPDAVVCIVSAGGHRQSDPVKGLPAPLSAGRRSSRSDQPMTSLT